jgi:myo-inositol-1(or 4)-monophosphatase
VLDPVRDELFTAVRGQGATLDGRAIHVSERTALDTIVVATGFYYDRDVAMERTLGTIRRLFGCGVRGVRRFGAAALDLCWIACGRFDAFFEYRLSVWDFAAAALIIREAGGRTEDRSGRSLDLSSSSVVAANPGLYDAFFEQVRWR